MATTDSSRDCEPSRAPRLRNSSSFLVSFLPTWTVSTDGRPVRGFWILTTLILIAGAALRLPGLFDDFWLDEIWSWSFTARIKSIGQIFFGIHHDNNHYLNTLWIYLCGTPSHWFVYRLHSYFAGVSIIIGCGLLAGDIADRSCSESKPVKGSREKDLVVRDAAAIRHKGAEFARTACLLTLFLVATCHMACVYSTEARGYALSGAAAVYATLALRRVVAKSSSTKLRFGMSMAYAWISIIGFLSHLSFITVFVPHFIWSTTGLLRRWCFWPIAVCFAPPFIAVAILWYHDLRLAKVGGSPPTSFIDVSAVSLALPTGAVNPPWLVILCAGVVLIGLLSSLILMVFKNLSDASLAILLLLLAAPLMLVIRPVEMLSPRHFLVVWMPLFPLLGLSLAWCWGPSKGRKAIAIGVLTFWLATNGWEFVEFVRHGRGGYSRAVDWLVDETRRSAALTHRPYWIGSDHDFRNRLVLYFYQKQIPLDVPLGYLSQDRWPPEGVDWVITHNFERDHVPPKELQIGPFEYDLAYFEPYAAPIGMHWAIYRRRDQPHAQNLK